MQRKRRPHLSYANVVATLALFIALGAGSAFAATELAKNSVGSHQLKSKAVTTGKIAPSAINGSKVLNKSLTAADINLKALGSVPSADSATSAGNADTVDRHAAKCPDGTTLFGGLCFDSESNAPVDSVKEASDACAGRGGFLPSVMELYSAREILNLGTGIGSDHQFTDEVYANTSGVNYSTVVIDGTGTIAEQSVEGIPSRYICAYLLLR
jgi:hypothetical protein